MKQKNESAMPQNVALKSSNTVPLNNSVIDDSLIPHFVKLRTLVYESFNIYSIYAAAKAGIADVLKHGPKTAEDIASETGNNPEAIYRLMRSLASTGFFMETSPRKFELTPIAELLQENHPMTLRPLVLMAGDHFWRDPWDNIMHSIKTGESSFEYTFKKCLFDYMQDHKDVVDLFQGFLAVFTNLNCPAIAASYPFSDFHKVIDIGGARGALLAHILKQHPSVEGVLFDLPEALQGQTEIEGEITQRCEIVGGDFFKAVPEGGDVYIMQQVIHDWSDEQATAILSNCRKAVTDDGRLLVVDAVLAPGNSRDINKLMDMHMLLGPGGRERSEQDFRQLFRNAGLELTRIIPTPSVLSFSIVEGKKI